MACGCIHLYVESKIKRGLGAVRCRLSLSLHLSSTKPLLSAVGCICVWKHQALQCMRGCGGPACLDATLVAGLSAPVTQLQWVCDGAGMIDPTPALPRSFCCPANSSLRPLEHPLLAYSILAMQVTESLTSFDDAESPSFYHNPTGGCCSQTARAHGLRT